MNESNLEAALEAFRLNVELYPNSANGYDSLAECNWKRGDLSAAIRYYEKAIALDHDGSVAANSAEMLKQIRVQVQSANK